MKGILFEYAILFHPNATKDQNERGESPKSEIIEAPKTALASDEKQVGVMAARSIPEQYLDKLDQVEIIVRPF